MRISDFFKFHRKKSQEPGTDQRADDLFEPETGTELPQAPEPAGIVPVPKVTAYTLPELFEPETGTEPSQAPEPAMAEPKKPGSFLNRFLQSLRKQAKTTIEEYDFLKNGPLVAGELLEGYTLIDQYWIDEGQSLVYIALNNRTNQTEYLLFEPVLSNFEYELLERLHEDLRDVLILSSDEIKKDRKTILLDKTMSLIDDYGLTLETQSLFKLYYYLLRNFIGWSRIDPLMNDPGLKIFPVTETGSLSSCITGSIVISRPISRSKRKFSTRLRSPLPSVPVNTSQPVPRCSMRHCRRGHDFS